MGYIGKDLFNVVTFLIFNNIEYIFWIKSTSNVQLLFCHLTVLHSRAVLYWDQTNIKSDCTVCYSS